MTKSKNKLSNLSIILSTCISSVVWKVTAKDPSLLSSTIGRHILGRTDTTSSAEDDRITSLPGLTSEPSFDMYSGYISIGGEDGTIGGEDGKDPGRHIFYLFTEKKGNGRIPNRKSPHLRKTDTSIPLVLWTNGGPGCSGLLGFGTEMGPFLYSRNGTLTPNPYAWNSEAHMLYVEQPVGVGFSYADDDADYTTDDAKAATDNLAFIRGFLDRYPQFRENPFYLASESYGGHYLPQLAKQIVDNNDDRSINFRGFLVGNPYTDAFTNDVEMFRSFYYDGLIPKPLYDQWNNACTTSSERGDSCDALENQLWEIMGDGINPYAMDFPVCVEEIPPRLGRRHGLSPQAYQLMVRTGKIPKSKKTPHPNAFDVVEDGGGEDVSTYAAAARKGRTLTEAEDDDGEGSVEYDPCMENYFTSYLQRKDVLEALHVVDASHAWSSCSGRIKYSKEDLLQPQMKYYRELLSNKEADLEILVYSGDDDSICATAGTQFWVYDLGYDPNPQKYWSEWKVNNQTAGYVTHFELGNGKGAAGEEEKGEDRKQRDTGRGKFIFATVHGAGHEVPTYKPAQALYMLRNFLQGDW